MGTPLRLTKRQQLKNLLQESGTHRVLSLDGGGVRGALSAAVLAKIEAKLRAYYGIDDLVLSDYFDVVAGTSTGSLLAAGIAKGMTAADLQKIYTDHGKKIFPSQSWWLSPIRTAATIFPWYSKYSPKPLEKVLKDTLGENLTFSGDELQCGLVVVAECVSVEGLSNPSLSTVFFNNVKLPEHPKRVTPTYKYSKDVKVWQACRASSAAPTYFPPFTMEWSDGGATLEGAADPQDEPAAASQTWARWFGKLGFTSSNNSPSRISSAPAKFDFIDGGISGYNNPENALLTALTAERYGVKWEQGPDKLLLVSVGTGYDYGAVKQGETATYNGVQWAQFIVNKLMSGDVVHQALAASVKCYSVVDTDRTNPADARKLPYIRILDREQKRKLSGKTATRLRFNVIFEKEKLEGLVPYVTPEQIESLRKMDDATAIPLLKDVGTSLANTHFDDIDLLEGFLPRASFSSED